MQMIKLKKLIETRGLETQNDYSRQESIELTGPEETDIDYYDDLNRMEKESGINILSNKELNTLAVQDEKLVGALYVSMQNDEFSFDVIVDKLARGQGIGAKLIDNALSQYREIKDDMRLTLKLDVVNQWVEKYLLKKGLKIVGKYGTHTIMTI